MQNPMSTQAWDADFVKMDTATLLDVVLAANYMNVPCLMTLTCKAVAAMIKGKTPEVIRCAAY